MKKPLFVVKRRSAQAVFIYLQKPLCMNPFDLGPMRSLGSRWCWCKSRVISIHHLCDTKAERNRRLKYTCNLPFTPSHCLSGVETEWGRVLITPLTELVHGVGLQWCRYRIVKSHQTNTNTMAHTHVLYLSRTRRTWVKLEKDALY